MLPGPKNSRKAIASVQRALDILNLYNSDHKELGNSEIAKLVGIPIGTASGLIYTLKLNKYLDQNPVNRKYHLGLKLAERASLLLEQLDIRELSTPYLDELRNWCGESVNLAIRDGNAVVYIERMFGNHSLGIRSELGKRAPLHSTALGKAIFANLPGEEREELLSQYILRPITQFTITDKNELKNELNKIRANGFALDEQENEVGGRCIGAPIFDHSGYPIGAISISIPVHRFPLEQTDGYGLRLKAAAAEISKRMGYLQR
jgi:DNA-binding IclR family transcriptional regulator